MVGLLVRAGRWLWRYWYIPFMLLAGVAGFVLGGRGPGETVKGELDAIDAGEKARLTEIDKGAEIANAEADSEYHRTIRDLDEKQRKKAEGLRRNPARRARFLNRLSGRGGG